MWLPHDTHAHSRASTVSHWLVQWSCHCSCMRILVRSPCLPGYNDVAKTVLVTLTMTGLFPDRPRVYIKNCQNSWNWTFKNLCILFVNCIVKHKNVPKHSTLFKIVPPLEAVRGYCICHVKLAPVSLCALYMDYYAHGMRNHYTRV